MKRIILALTFLLALSSVASAQFTPTKENLRGLPGVRVIVMFGRADGLPDETQRAELLKTLEADAKAKLQEAGILFSKSKYADEIGKARLIVLVTLDQPNGFVPPILTEVKLVQKVRLARDPSIEFDAVSWSNYGVGAPKLKIPVIQQLVGDLIDQFIRDYLAENPKQSVSSNKDRSKITKR